MNPTRSVLYRAVVSRTVVIPTRVRCARKPFRFGGRSGRPPPPEARDHGVEAYLPSGDPLCFPMGDDPAAGRFQDSWAEPRRPWVGRHGGDGFVSALDASPEENRGLGVGRPRSRIASGAVGSAAPTPVGPGVSVVSNEGHVVRIAGTGSFLPNDPVGNDRIDAVLGELTGADPGVRRFLEGVGRRMLRQSGVESRHFAVDPSTGRLTHTVASLAEEAARRALATAGCEPRDVELLVLGTGNSDMTTPPTSALLQERLGIESCAEIEVLSNCAGLGKGVQIAVDALRVGRYERALVAYAQHSSSFLRAAWFNQARVTPQQAMLRYILSDGAAAIVLERDVGGTRGVDGAVRGEVLGTHVESVGGRRAAGMTLGGGVLDATRFDAPVLGGYEAGASQLRVPAPVSAHGGRVSPCFGHDSEPDGKSGPSRSVSLAARPDRPRPGFPSPKFRGGLEDLPVLDRPRRWSWSADPRRSARAELRGRSTTFPRSA